MCGRYTLSAKLSALTEVFDVPPPGFEQEPRFNIAPGQQAPVVAADGRGPTPAAVSPGAVPTDRKKKKMSVRNGQFPRPAGGAGLGLAICREVMAKLGGTIDYIPGLGGAAFRVTVPHELAVAAE